MQNQRSTYIRVSRFTGKPFLLPRYCNNRLIILEYARQLASLQALLTLNHKTRITLLVSLEHYTCPNIQVTKAAEQELEDLSLKEFDYAREWYDPYRKLKQMMPKLYEGHKSTLEDFWANLQDSFKVREKGYYRLSVPQIIDFEIKMNILKELRDDGELLYPELKEKGIFQKPLTPIRWSNQEELDIEIVTAKVLERTKQWLSLRIRPSVAKGNKKGKATNDPQAKVHKEYVRRTRSDSRRNTSIDLEEATTPIDTQELKRQLDTKMKESQFFKIVVEHGINIGLQAIP